MDIMSWISEEQELDRLLFREGMNKMSELERMNVVQLQDEALMAYERLPGAEAMAASQAAMLAQIALELAQINKFLEAMSKRVEEA